jgi:hypothetical protein
MNSKRIENFLVPKDRQNDPHVAWRNRCRAAANARVKVTVWMLTPKCSLVRAYVKDLHHVRSLMFASDEKELTDYYKWSLDPIDCDQVILKYPDRTVYMAWKALDQSSDKNINIPATRILLDYNMLEPPSILNNQPNLMNYTHVFPSDHVVLYQTSPDGDPCHYTQQQLTYDWEIIFKRQRVRPYMQLAGRYQHFSQALVEYEQTGSMNPLVRMIISQYLRRPAGPVDTWDQAQMALLGAAMYMMYKDDWQDCTRLPVRRRVR